MCDADSGECVCPPGFNGTKCEHGRLHFYGSSALRDTDIDKARGTGGGWHTKLKSYILNTHKHTHHIRSRPLSFMDDLLSKWMNLCPPPHLFFFTHAILILFLSFS